ncbi:PspC domain-containing protein [Corynebacterium pilbarense]|uniref:PspC domain-containing protein n=1 Tax=Corynebacterium pilbarense TaxID=1288393 RepID=A0A9Q4NRF8_9CORY|nr:PspC domain-containing protein [Corynebacterium pilbarense]MCZ2220196.1 PspC domain-containing protein [Corynebacterium pilbarense]
MENNTLTQMWDTRPPRIPEDQGGKAVIGGVCEGIGARFRIDPTFIRVVFVALSLVFGGGIFLYLLCWINMPRFGLTRSPWGTIITPKQQLTKAEIKDRDTGWLLLLGLFLFFPSASVAGDLRAVLVTFILFAAGWYFLHQRQPEPPAGLLVGESEGARTSNRAAVDTSHLTVPEGHEHPGQRPPAWDPLGAAPELWHLPEPSEPAPQQLKKRNWFWIPVTLVLTTATVFALGVISEVRLGNYSRFGSAHITVSDEAALPDIMRPNGFVGDAFLDLTELEPLSEPKTVTLENPIGRTDITLPNNVPVDVNCEVTIGETACPEETQNADTDSALLTINVKQRVGSVSAYYAE